MRVLLTIYSPADYPGGAEISVSGLIKGLKKLGHDIIVASTGAYFAETRKFAKYRFVPNFWLQEKYLERKLLKIIKDEKIDIVHANDRLTAIGAIRAAKKSGVPVVVSFRDYWFVCPKSSCLNSKGKICEACSVVELLKCSAPYRWRWDIYKYLHLRGARKTLNEACAKLANSSAVRERLMGAGICDSVAVVGITRDLSEFKRSSPPAKPAVLFVGSLTKNKGLDKLLSVMEKIMFSRPDVKFTIVGRGPLEKNVKKWVSKNQFDGRVNFLGRVSRSDMPAVYRSASVIAFPSVWAEPLSGVLLEAVACGRPVVAFDVGGNSEVIKNNETGALVPAGDFEKFRIALVKLISKPITVDGLPESLDYKKVSKKIANIYERCVNERK